MQWSWLVPVLICASIAIGTVMNTWIRARHGYPLEDDDGNTVHRTDPDAGRKIDLLASENEMLVGRISRLEERIACLLYTSPSPRDRQKSRMPSSA